MQPLRIGLDWVAKADIDGHGVETPASQLAVDVVTHGSTLADFIEAISSLDSWLIADCRTIQSIDAVQTKGLLALW